MSNKIDTQPQVAYCSSAKLELADSQNESEPITDLLTIRKSPDIHIRNDIGKIFKGHNLFEYKFPCGDMDIETFLQSVGYACLYLAYADSSESISDDDITVSLVRMRKPKRLFKQLARRGFVIKEDGKGIYQIHGLHFFTIQVIVSDELDENEYIWLKSFTRAMENENAERLILTVGNFNEC